MLNEATTVFALMIGIGSAAAGGLLVGLGLLILAIVLLSQRKLRLRYSAPVAAASAPLADGPHVGPQGAPARPPVPGVLPPAWSGFQLPPAGPLGWPPPGVPPAPSEYAQPPYPGGYVPPYTTLPPAAAYDLGPLRSANGRTGPFLEAFAIYIAGQILVSLAARLLLRDASLAVNFVVLLPVLVAVCWPWVRGVRGAEYRRGFGFVAPGGLLRELGSGVVGYVAGLPVAAVGMLVTILLVRLTGASPSHPIIHEAAGAGRWQTVLIFALAAVWAPVVEELFFRGALFHHLRTRWGWLMSALLSSLIFAAVHPQGWSLVPGLAGLAVVFSAIREWRCSTYAGMAAHALHNGTIVTLLVVGMG